MVVGAGALALIARAADVGSTPAPDPLLLPTTAALRDPPPRVPIFYPPVAPAPGAVIDRVRALQQPGWDAPVAGRDLVGEWFYPTFESLVAERILPRAEQTRLDRYRQHRDEALAALRASLAARAPPPADTALRELEREADQLGHNLLAQAHRWQTHRRWTLAPSDEVVDPAVRLVREYNLLRAAAFYFEGLSAHQRQLLWEFAVTLGRGVESADQVPAPVARPGAEIFFLPATATIRLPDALPPALLADLQAFLAAKHRVQTAIAAHVIAQEAQPLNARFVARPGFAAEQQAPIDALERQAEILRVRLAELPPAPPSSRLPASAMEIVQAFEAKQRHLQQQVLEQLARRRKELCAYQPGAETLMWKTTFRPGQVATGTFSVPDEMGALAVETPGQAGRTAEVTKELKTTVDRFLAAHVAEQRAIEQERARVVRAVAQALDPGTPAEGTIPPELVSRAIRWLQANEQAQRVAPQTELVAATLRPGLSPAARRLLFNAALAQLELPLPAGVRRPVFWFNEP